MFENATHPDPSIGDPSIGRADTVSHADDPAMHGEPGYALAVSDLAHRAGTTTASKFVDRASAVAVGGERSSSFESGVSLAPRRAFEFKSARASESGDGVGVGSPSNHSASDHAASDQRNARAAANATIGGDPEIATPKTADPIGAPVSGGAPIASRIASSIESSVTSGPTHPPEPSAVPPVSHGISHGASHGLYFGPSPTKPAEPATRGAPIVRDPVVREPVVRETDAAPAAGEPPVVNVFSTVQQPIDAHLEELRRVVDRAHTHESPSAPTRTDDPARATVPDAGVTTPKYTGPIGFVPFSDRERAAQTGSPVVAEGDARSGTDDDADSQSAGRDQPPTRFPRIHNPHITFQSKAPSLDHDAPARPARATPGRHDPTDPPTLAIDTGADTDTTQDKKIGPPAPPRPTIIEQNYADGSADGSFVGSVASLAGVGSLAELSRRASARAAIDPEVVRELQITAVEILGALRRMGEQIDQQQTQSEKLLAVVERIPAMLGTMPMLHDAQEEMSRAVRSMEQTVSTGNAKADVLTARQTETMSKQTGVLRELGQSVSDAAATHTHVANAMTDLHTAFTGVRGSNEKLQSAMEAIAKRQDKREYALAKLVRRAQFTAMVAFLVAFFSVAAAALALALAISPELRRALGL